MERCAVKRFKRIISPIMVLLILFSNLQLPYLQSEVDPQVYAAENASDSLISAKLAEGADLSTVAVSVYSEVEIVELDKDWLTADLILAGNAYTELESVYVNITSDLNLPVEGLYGSTIAWESSDDEVIAVDGTVKRPANAQGNTRVDLVASIYTDMASWQVGFTVEVKALDPTDEDSFLAQDMAWLSADLVLNGNTGAAEVDGYGYIILRDIINDLNMPANGPNGCLIS